MGRFGCLIAFCLTIALAVACGSGDEQTGGGRTAAPTQDNSALCARPVPALTAEPVTRERLQAAIDKMREVSSAAEAGGTQAANAAFSGDTHTITHDIDPPLRAADQQLAQDLCAAIVVLEQQFGANPDLVVVADQSAVAAGLLEESGRELGVFD